MPSVVAAQLLFLDVYSFCPSSVDKYLFHFIQKLIQLKCKCILCLKSRSKRKIFCLLKTILEIRGE